MAKQNVLESENFVPTNTHNSNEVYNLQVTHSIPVFWGHTFQPPRPYSDEHQIPQPRPVHLLYLININTILQLIISILRSTVLTLHDTVLRFNNPERQGF